MAPARELVTGLSADNVLADRAYDADHLVELIRSQGGTPVIPPRRHRKIDRGYDQDLYKARSDIECFFSKINHFRRIATRYDKLAAVYLGFVKLAAIHVWLRYLNGVYSLKRDAKKWSFDRLSPSASSG